MPLLLALCTIASWVWNMGIVMIVLQSLLTTPQRTRTYELSYSVSYGGRLEICASRYHKIEGFAWANSHETMCYGASTKPVIHALNIGLGIVQMVAVLIYMASRL